MNNSTIVDLSEVMAYSNETIIYRFQMLFDVSEAAAIDVFEETKKWLYACELNYKLQMAGEHDFALGISDDILIIDEMWHNFILCTKDYMDFCDTYFNRFIHHNVTTKAEAAKYGELDFEEAQEEQKTFFTKQYSFIYDVLGKDTLVKWHKEYPVKYSVENIKALRK